jgi:hypothetical protein
VDGESERDGRRGEMGRQEWVVAGEINCCRGERVRIWTDMSMCFAGEERKYWITYK